MVGNSFFLSAALLAPKTQCPLLAASVIQVILAEVASKLSPNIGS